MSFISYSQNFEDLMLYRALGHIESGFYVDVGAQHPVRDSVTAAFYERGWRGINIEPVPKWARLLRRLRERDINLEVAIHPSADVVEIHEAPGGLSTSVSAYAEGYRANGLPIRSREVAATRLDAVLAAHAGRDIHFLKIDVEGAESLVLESISLDIHRPWIIVIEATRPGTPEVVSGKWEHLVVQAGYHRVYWDGLNVFYVAHEHMALSQAFSCPPNVFDEVQLAETIRTITRFARRAQIAHQQAQVKGQLQLRAEQRCADMSRRVADLEQQASRVADLEQQVSRIEGLEQQVSRIAGLEEDVARIPALKQAVSRMAELEYEAKEALDRVSVRDGQLRSLEEWAAELVQQGRRGVAMRRQLHDELAPLRAQAARVGVLERELAAVRGSSSWLITAPLRLAISVVRKEMPPKEAAKRVVRGGVRAVWVRVRHRTVLAQRLVSVVARQPRLYAWLQRAATQGEPTVANASVPTKLSARAKSVLDALAAGVRAPEHS